MITRKTCKICNNANKIRFHVSDYIWALVIPKDKINNIVCLGCFTKLADEKLIAWVNNIQFYPISLCTSLLGSV